MHVPTATVVTAEPATVHTGSVPELNNTGSPAGDADADRMTGMPTVTSGGCAKVIVGAAGPAWTWNDRVTSGAARGGSPSWKAVIVHVPAATVVTVEPATVHTGGVPELNNTGSPAGDADADRMTGMPTVTSGGCAKVIVGGPAVVDLSEAFCTFVDELVFWWTPPANLAGPPTIAARRQIPRNLHSPTGAW